ncbi:guanylate kinase/L-type calcium channel beta subunit [Crucibulum laeve]|uniref:Guanylate kinase n=1 Tax=Crucibulum laeve TaxID=68775 RepID=A0A5C3LVM3_9AGAR|nr:guanylate kinase/L-type calcium channel beta subunit [Crucibulum laeve]
MTPRPDFLRPLVLSGPSGVGKSTLLQRLFAEFPDKFGFSVSHTTRDPRPGEEHGKHYFFVTHSHFEDLIKENAFIEHAQFSGNRYGTSFETVRNIQQQGRRCILDIEAQGVRQIKQTSLNPVYLFISPPSMATLRSRLQQRGTESEASVQKRLNTAIAEIQYAKEPNVHDLVIINDDLDRAYDLFKKVAQGEQIQGDTLPPLDD